VRALTIDGKGHLWIATFHEVIVLDVRNQLPDTVSNEWITQRAKLLVPIQIITNVGEWLFAPAMNFMYVSLYFCSIIYMALLALIILAIMGMLWGSKQESPKLFRASRWTLISSIIGVILLWFFSFLVASIPT